MHCLFPLAGPVGLVDPLVEHGEGDAGSGDGDHVAGAPHLRIWMLLPPSQATGCPYQEMSEATTLSEEPRKHSVTSHLWALCIAFTAALPVVVFRTHAIVKYLSI